jgi:hypothetical protein
MPDKGNTVSVELAGKDSVGKGSACKTMLGMLQNAQAVEVNGQRIESEDILVVHTDFPQYWGLGSLIKTMNSSVGRRYFENMNQQDVLHLRKGLYAIDRLVSLIVLQDIQSRTDKTILHVSDRGPLSQVVTHAACFEEPKRGFFQSALEILLGILYADYEEPGQRFMDSIPEVQDADIAYISALSPHPIILEAIQSGIGEGGRAILDDLEKLEFQQLSEKGFDTIRDNRMFGATSVVTRTPEGWRDKKQIALETLEKAGIKVVDSENIDPAQFNALQFEEAIKSGKLVQIEVEEFLNTFYPDADKFEVMALREFGSFRRVLYFAGREGTSEVFARATEDLKNIFIQIEGQISNGLAKIMRKNRVSRKAIANINPETKEAGRYLLKQYTKNELLYFIRYLEEHKELSFQYSRFLEDIFLFN